MERNWKKTKDVLPPDGLIVETKIDDEDGCRNQTYLYRKKNLWFLPEKDVYVYYKPTHWR